MSLTCSIPGRATAASITRLGGPRNRERLPIRHSNNKGTMSNTIVNYDGSITTNPKQLVYPQNVQDIQAILRDPANYPGPVRAKGSYHSLTPCVSSDGTIVDM